MTSDGPDVEPAVESAAGSVAPSEPPGALARRTASNVAMSALGQLVGKVATFGWTVVAARRLGQEAFGVFSVALAGALIISAVSEWGFDTALVQRASHDPEHRDRYLTEALAWELGLGVVLFGVGGVAVVQLLSGQHVAAVALVVSSVFLDTFSDTLRAAAGAAQRQGATSVALITQRMLAAVVAIGLLLDHRGLVGLGAALAATSAAGLAAHVVAVRRIGFRVHPRLLGRSGLRAFGTGTGAIGLSALVLAALFRIDAVMLEGFRGARAVGIYSVAYKLFDTSLFVAFALTGAFFPVMSVQVRQPRQLQRTLAIGIAAGAFCYVPFAAFCLVDAHPLLQLLYGPSYAGPAAAALRWLAPAPIMFGLAFLSGSTLNAYRRTAGLLVSAVVATVVNVLGNLVAIPALGGTGAALMTTASYAIQAGVTLLYVRRVSGLPLGIAPELTAPLAGGLVFGVLLGVLPGGLGVGLAVGVPSYFAVWWAVVRRVRPGQLAALRVLIPRRREAPGAGAGAAPGR